MRVTDLHRSNTPYDKVLRFLSREGERELWKGPVGDG